MGIYADPKLLAWFKKVEAIPYELVGKLAAKMTVKDWVSQYEKHVKS